mgnify:CR=1 FL=1
MRIFKVFFCLGITDENLDKLLNHAAIPIDKRNIIANLQHLNLQIIQDQNRVC